MGLTNLLPYLREVILYDSLTLRKCFPTGAVWNHAVFQNKSYGKFAEAAIELVGDKE